jgi:CBS domain-containing protein
MNAEDIMTRDPLTVSDQTTIGEALQLLEEHDIRHLPVVRDDAVVGMLSERDLRGLGLALLKHADDPERVRSRLTGRIAALMSGAVVTVDADADLKDVVDILIEEKIGAVPVVEPGTAHLVGIISYIDVLREARDGFA